MGTINKGTGDLDEEQKHSIKHHSRNLPRTGVVEYRAAYGHKEILSECAERDSTTRTDRMAKFNRRFSGKQVVQTSSGILPTNKKQTEQPTVDSSIGEETSRNDVANVGSSQHREQRKSDSDLIIGSE